MAKIINGAIINDVDRVNAEMRYNSIGQDLFHPKEEIVWGGSVCGRNEPKYWNIYMPNKLVLTDNSASEFACGMISDEYSIGSMEKNITFYDGDQFNVCAQNQHNLYNMLLSHIGAVNEMYLLVPKSDGTGSEARKFKIDGDLNYQLSTGRYTISGAKSFGALTKPLKNINAKDLHTELGLYTCDNFVDIDDSIRLELTVVKTEYGYYDDFHEKTITLDADCFKNKLLILSQEDMQYDSLASVDISGVSQTWMQSKMINGDSNDPRPAVITMYSNVFPLIGQPVENIRDYATGNIMFYQTGTMRQVFACLEDVWEQSGEVGSVILKEDANIITRFWLHNLAWTSLAPKGYSGCTYSLLTMNIYHKKSNGTTSKIGTSTIEIPFNPKGYSVGKLDAYTMKMRLTHDLVWEENDYLTADVEIRLYGLLRRQISNCVNPAWHWDSMYYDSQFIIFDMQFFIPFQSDKMSMKYLEKTEQISRINYLAITHLDGQCSYVETDSNGDVIYYRHFNSLGLDLTDSEDKVVLSSGNHLYLGDLSSIDDGGSCNYFGTFGNLATLDQSNDYWILPTKNNSLENGLYEIKANVMLSELDGTYQPVNTVQKQKLYIWDSIGRHLVDESSQAASGYINNNLSGELVAVVNDNDPQHRHVGIQLEFPNGDYALTTLDCFMQRLCSSDLATIDYENKIYYTNSFNDSLGTNDYGLWSVDAYC